MTIFLQALKKLVKDELSTLIIALKSKIGAYGHNQDLSNDQHERIMVLDNELIGFQGTGNDPDDVNLISAIIDKASKDIYDIRVRYGAGPDGNTYKTLTNLRTHLRAFLNKISEFKINASGLEFDLLNKKNIKSPENIVYYHACCYLGDDIFNSVSTNDIAVRMGKEACLLNRLERLRVEPTSSLDQLYKETSQFFDDLDKDNIAAINTTPLKKAGNSLPIPLSSVKLLDVISLSAPIDALSPSLGNLSKEFEMAKRKIESLMHRPSEYGRPDESESYVLPSTASLFLKALKKLIKDELCGMIVSQKNKVAAKPLTASYRRYNPALSKDQQAAIIALEAKIVCYSAKGSDKQSKDEIISLIDGTLEEVRLIRNFHKVTADTGSTVSGLTNLRDRVSICFNNIETFAARFSFLERDFALTPESLFYYHACCYLGELSFSNATDEMSSIKRNAVVVQLESLNNLIKPDHSWIDRQKCVEKVLADLRSSLIISGFWGSTNYYGGNIAREFDAVGRKIIKEPGLEIPLEQTAASSSSTVQLPMVR